MMRAIKYIYTFLIIFIYQGHCYPFDQNFVEQIYKEHKETLDNTAFTKKPLIICFSGTPGMGKSFVAKILEKKYSAVRISTDEIRAILHTHKLDPKQHEEFFRQYFIYFFKQYLEPNRFFILDFSIDRRYKDLFPFFEKKEIPFMVIRLQVSRETVMLRLQNREGDAAAPYLAKLDTWWHDYAAFGEKFTQSYVLDTNNTLGLTDLFSWIDSKKP